MARIRSRQTIMILGYLAIGIVLAQNPVDEKTTFEAAFQGSNGSNGRRKGEDEEARKKRKFALAECLRSLLIIPRSLKFVFLLRKEQCRFLLRRREVSKSESNERRAC
uniref:Uncharacterized protein n=1 Tax=Vespula pensylvanica TaxID=30213 RepID=A0A834KLK0_VESPE|nr:hypothetical protein H0235_013810 [Vespula pensylvanica]